MRWNEERYGDSPSRWRCRLIRSKPRAPVRARRPGRDPGSRPLLFPAFVSLLLLQAISPEQFFVGRTEGTGTVRVILSGSHNVRSHNRGRMERGGAIVIDQVVEEEGAAARRRTWRLVRTSGGGLTGTLTDADGPVTGEVAGNVLHLRYRSNEGPAIEQWITLHPGGRSAGNRMTFRRFGFGVATLEEVIRRVD